MSGNASILHEGGGIAKWLGTLTMMDSSSVTGNTAPGGGGICSNSTDLLLGGSSSVRGSAATAEPGGGIRILYGVLIMRGSSSVAGNTSSSSGGGISKRGRVKACVTWNGAISPNTPDDPPRLTWINC